MSYSELMEFYMKMIQNTPKAIYDVINLYGKLLDRQDDVTIAKRNATHLFFCILPSSVRQYIHSRTNKTIEEIKAWDYDSLKNLLMAMLRENAPTMLQEYVLNDSVPFVASGGDSAFIVRRLTPAPVPTEPLRPILRRLE